MTERVYPKPQKPYNPNLSHRWLVEYNLVYGGDGGGWSQDWSKSYRTKTGAKVASWYHYHLGSWGGSVEMTDQWQYAREE